jgi:DNA-binding NarL/FixJ family response regulator
MASKSHRAKTPRKAAAATVTADPTPAPAPAPAPPPPQPRKNKVLVVDDHPMVRERLADLINEEPDLVVCGEAEDGHGALEAIKNLRPDVAIVDITLKDTYGIELIKDIKIRHPDLPVLVLSMHDESMYAERALRAGARGYLTKQEATRKVLDAIRRVLRGEVYVSEKMAATLLRRVAGSRREEEAQSPTAKLTDRELEIFQLIGQGLSTRQIAENLHLSVKTIEAHKAHIKEKLSLKTSSELLRYAIRETMQEGDRPRPQA